MLVAVTHLIEVLSNNKCFYWWNSKRRSMEKRSSQRRSQTGQSAGDYKKRGTGNNAADTNWTTSSPLRGLFGMLSTSAAAGASLPLSGEIGHEIV
jgi:hypothetical protein